MKARIINPLATSNNKTENISEENKIFLITDTATSAKMNIAIGAFVCLDNCQMKHYAEYTIEKLYTELIPHIIYTQYKSNKSTSSEIKTVIDALLFLDKKTTQTQKIEMYTDCQSLCDLLGRRKAKLLNNHFITRAGKVLQNADLYKELYRITNQFEINVFKIKGHDSKIQRETLQEKIFHILDQLSRKMLRSLVDDNVRKLGK